MNDVKYINEYNKKNYFEIRIRIRKDTNEDVIEKLNSVESKNQYIVDLIKKDIEPEDEDKL